MAAVLERVSHSMPEHSELVSLLSRLRLIVAGKMEVPNDEALQVGINVEDRFVALVQGLSSQCRS